MGDNSCGTILAGGVAAALFAREKTGKGDKVSVSLFGLATWVMSLMNTAVQPPFNYKYPKTRFEGRPITIPYECADGEWIMINIMEWERYRDAFCAALEIPQVADDPRFHTAAELGRNENRESLVKILEEAFHRFPSDVIDQRLTEADVVHSRLAHFKDAVDGYNHCVYIDPAQELLATMEEKRKADLKQEALLQSLKKKPNVTLDGREIKVYANIGNAGDVGLVLRNDAQGIGLLRSEFIYLESEDFPTEDTQFDIYKRVVETMAVKKVIIRTLDIGADKQWKLSEFFRAIGQKKHGEPLRPRWNELVGSRGRGHFKPRPYTKKDGSEGKANNVEKFYDYDPAAMGAGDWTDAGNVSTPWDSEAF